MPERIRLRAGAFALGRKRELKRAGHILRKHRLFLILSGVFMLVCIVCYIPAVCVRELSFTAPARLGESVVIYEVYAPRTEEDEPLDLNTATREELLSVSGIGERTADMIIAYREALHGFITVMELRNIDGISKEKYEQIKKYFTVSQEYTGQPSY